MDLATIRELFNYNDWARDKVMGLAEDLEVAQLDRAFEMGEGSLRKTLEHLFGAEWTWLERIKGRSPVSGECPRGFVTPAALWEAWRQTADERDRLLETTTNADLSSSVAFVGRDGRHYSFTLGHVLMHVCNHGTHHRAQALNMLRHLGVAIPETDLLCMFE